MNTRTSKAARRLGWTIGAMMLGMAFGCGGDPASPAGDAGETRGDAGEAHEDGGEMRGDGGTPVGGDGGPLVGDDDGGTPVGVDGGTDASAPISDGEIATWSVSGAQSASRMHDGDVNYVSCTLTSSGGLLDMTSAEVAGGDPAITVRIRSYTGPGSFEFTDAPGGGGATADVRLSGGYKYWFFYDYSTVDFSEVPSTCSITVSEPDPGARIHATISCANLVAQITSPDYDDRNAAGFRPAVSLTATFDCDI